MEDELAGKLGIRLDHEASKAGLSHQRTQQREVWDNIFGNKDPEYLMTAQSLKKWAGRINPIMAIGKR